MSTVSDNIRYLRKLKGFTQEQFAERIGIKRSLLGAYEEARANPNEIYLDTMADLLGVEVEHLLNENLRERGRSLAPGTILKLNPAMPEPVKNPEPSPERTVREGAMPAGNVQMDLFEPSPVRSSEPVAGEVKSTEAPQAVVEAGEPKDLAEVLRKLLNNQQLGVRLFENPGDLPVQDSHVLAQKLQGIEMIANNELYVVITTKQSVYFRRAFNLLQIKGTVILSSDFPGIPTLELSKSDIAEVYRYLGSFTTATPSASLPVQRLRELTGEMAKLLAVQ